MCVNIYYDIHPHVLCARYYFTHTRSGFRGTKGKQVALKCYEIIRWHTRISIYNIYISDYIISVQAFPKNEPRVTEQKLLESTILFTFHFSIIT